jgi:Tfp pilus assembly protein FimV
MIACAMYGGRPARRSPARYLAPLALAASITATIVVIENGLGAPPARHPVARLIPRHAGHRSAARGPRYYTVKLGDTLSAIALRTGVALATLQALNPNVSANSLQPGQRLRLRR